MEREIGERFYIDDKQYEIVEDKNGKCKDCCFNDLSCLDLMEEYIGCCGKLFRKDNKDIIVKQLKK